MTLGKKTAIVTGVYAGIGLETVKAFAAAGATVIVPARDIAKATNNLQDLPNVTIEKMGLMDPNSVDQFAQRFLATHETLHLLVKNADIMWVPL